MAEKKKIDKSSPFYQALNPLKKQLVEEDKETEKKGAEQKKAEAARAAASSRREDEAALFAAAMNGVTPIDQKAPAPKPRRTQAQLEGYGEDEDQEVLRELRDLVGGKAVLDFNFSDEFVEGRARDCSQLDLAKLKNGDYSIQGQLDLHGHNREEARAAVQGFFDVSIKKGNRCVVVVCGRGHGSPGGKPVLKELLVRWLVQGQLSRYVLSFCSAKAHDGGVGALYVLLRSRL